MLERLPALLVALVPVLPALAALWVGGSFLLGRAAGERETARVALGAQCVALLLLAAVAIGRATGRIPAEILAGRWLSSGSYAVDWRFRLDALALGGAAVGLGMCGLVTRFSVAYMHRERGFHRFFFGLCLFSAAIALFALSGSAVMSFLGWEGAGCSSYLLIGYAYDRITATRNATRAFVTNRLGDAAFGLGIGLMFRWTGGVTWATLNATDLRSGRDTALALCFLGAAVAKSAAVPLSPWVSRALEGPTPSSALFYGGVMTSFGAFLLIRTAPLFEVGHLAAGLLVAVGFATAVYGFLSGLVATDAKSAAMFSTTGQIGLIFILCGLGFPRIAAVILACHTVVRGYQMLLAPSALRQMAGRRARPVPARLARMRWLYIAALRRFWLEELGIWLVEAPMRHAAHDLAILDAAVIERATGLPLAAGNARPSLAHIEAHILAEYARAAGTEIGLARGIVGRAAQWTAAGLSRFEERMVLEGVGHGIPAAGGRIARSLNRVEQLLARPWVVAAGVALTLLALLGGGGG